MIRLKASDAVEIDITGTLDAQDLEVLIKQLVTIRCEMQPPITATAPTDEELQEGAVTIYDDGSFEARCRPDGTCSLLARNAGLGWMVCTLTPATELKLRDLFQTSTSNAQPRHMKVHQGTG